MAFSTFFVTIGPVDVAAVFSVLASSLPNQHRIMLVACGTACGILLVFAMAGDLLLGYLGISLAALRISGGILLLLTGIDLVFRAHSDSASMSKSDAQEARNRTDIAIFPIAMPLLAGPAAITSVIILMAGTQGDPAKEAQVIGAILATLVLCYCCMLLSRQFGRVLRRSGLNVIARLTGLLLTALATQFIIDGIKDTGLFG